VGIHNGACSLVRLPIAVARSVRSGAPAAMAFHRLSPRAASLGDRGESGRVTSTWKVATGEGCLLYATSHGTIHGIWVARDSDGGRILKPTSLKTMLAAACGDAPTVVVMSGCHTGTFLHKDTVGPNTIMLTAADTYQKSFGCRAGRRYTYYDACFLQEFPRATTWQDLYRRVSGCVDVEERSLREQSSSPQAFFGRQMKDLPLPGKN